jgi:hypothetical protein
MTILVHAEVFRLHLVLFLALAYVFFGFRGACCSNDGLLLCTGFVDVVEELDASVVGVT